MTGVPLVHLDRWLDGSDPVGVATAVDAALRDVGFFVVVGHGIPRELIAETRRLYTEFFHLPGIHKAGDVTLKRGVIGAQNLYEWLELGRTGKLAQVKRDIVVKLQSEDRAGTVVSWKLRGAMPIKWTGPTLTAKGGGDIAIEELVLSVETI